MTFNCHTAAVITAENKGTMIHFLLEFRANSHVFFLFSFSCLIKVRFSPLEMCKLMHLGARHESANTPLSVEMCLEKFDGMVIAVICTE